MILTVNRLIFDKGKAYKNCAKFLAHPGRDLSVILTGIEEQKCLQSILHIRMLLSLINSVKLFR